MPVQVKFKKSMLAECLHVFFSTNDMNKLLCAGIFLGIFSTSAYAQDVPSINSNTSIPLNTTTAATSDAALASDTQLAQDKIKDALKDQQSDVDSQQMLQEQQKNQNNDAFKPIQFEDLENLPVTPVDQSMADEIYKVAEQAKQEADTFGAGAGAKADQVINDATSQEVSELTQAPVNVEQLMHSIQADNKIEVERNETGRTLANLDAADHSSEPEKKPGFFQRIIDRFNPRKSTNEAAPKISATVTGAPDILANNIKAKLSAFTVESFSDYNSALPQMRSLASQAAQAVGYYNAQFKFSKLNDAEVKVEVTPNEPVKVKEQNLDFSGPGANLPQFQVIKVLPDLNTGDIFNSGLYEKTKTRISDAATNNGFFDSYWRLHDVKVAQPENTANINLRYETGNRYKIAGVQFKMSDPNKPLPIDLEVLKKLAPWKDGDDYAFWKVNSLANNLTNSRYFNYTLVDAIKPDPIEHPLELPPDLEKLVEEEGISEADLLGSAYKPKAVTSSKEVTQNVVNEDQFAGVKDKETNANLSRLQAQQEEQKSEDERLKDQAREDQKIPVIVTLNADRLNNVEAGIGYGTDTGVRLRTQYRRSIVNRHGHSFDANMELSQIRQSIEGHYNIPYKHPLNDYFALVGGYEREERDGVGPDMGLTTETAVAGIDRIIKNPRGQWQQTYGLRYRLDRLKQKGAVNEEDIPDSFKIPGAQAEQQSLLIGAELSKTDSNNRLNPTKGFKQSYKLQLGSDAVLSDVNMAIVNADWGFIYSLGKNDDHQFVGRAGAGYIFTDDFEKVPYNLRFFAGGDQSIRGFDYKSLSPMEFGYKVGGQGLAIGSMEYNYQFKEGWRAAIFSDFGNAYDQDFKNDTQYSLGLGIRWKSPIGPIRLDVASGISDPNHPIRLHFFIGSQL
ncbi:autotransporter assembly complex protein TamA [Acinetobacter stercoris]|uniref:Translocation and assembly module subunit TamA n=1 Tax=Acinetobacter stercoris TaxID=2126983 RepID=A0A2U3MVC8_9GAMM|nr:MULTISPECIES: BamA/TamA family outer membrane protein [Acinetobacter]SPL69325.1 Translocation and assembly module TamA precursor [Acinetobacter stercoris]